MRAFVSYFFSNWRGRKTKLSTGVVLDDKGGPLSGATVRVLDSAKGVNTDADGKFTLSVPPEATMLAITYVGYEPQEIAMRNLTTFRVSLRPTRSSLDEVVVVGYGIQRRKDVTGSVASVKGNDIKELPVTDITAALQGRAAGVEVIQNSGQPGGSTPTIIIRGLSSLHQPAPLYIVDGVRVPGDNINIQDIATVDILKDASAAAIYGSAAAGGVILITTKKGSGSKPQVNFNARYGVSVPKLYDNLLRKKDYITLRECDQPDLFQECDRNGYAAGCGLGEGDLWECIRAELQSFGLRRQPFDELPPLGFLQCAEGHLYPELLEYRGGAGQYGL